VVFTVFWNEKPAHHKESDELHVSIISDINKALPYINNDIKSVVESAIKGDHNSQFAVGLLYYKNEVIPENFNKAAYWFSKSTEQGNLMALNLLAVMYRLGKGVAKDSSKAIALLQIAAQREDKEAQYRYGAMLYSGEGIRQDVRQGMYWIRKAANQGHVEAQEVLDELDMRGISN
jgi:TPR repeat protein